MTKSKLAKLIVIAASVFFVSIYANAKAKPTEVTYELMCSAQPEFRFNDIKQQLFIKTSCDVDNSQIYDLSQLPKKIQKSTLRALKFVFEPEVSDFFEDSFREFVSKSGFPVGYDRNNNYTLKANLKEFKCTNGIGRSLCTVVIDWAFISPDHIILFDGQAKGKHTLVPGQGISDSLDKAYEKALKDIDWQGIFHYLGNVTSDSITKEEKQVNGDGSTDLEHTIIRWYILSSPQGADVSWRVVSSTSDVKNTNSKFVGTTPYETTESFDIKGMNYNNSGNIQIEITCEKPGYITQTKRFNLRQAIDQKEITTKFNLVKESDE